MKSSVFKLLRPLRIKIAAFMFLVLCATVCDLLLPFVMRTIVTEGIENQNFPVVWQRCLIMLGIASASFTLMCFGIRLSTKIVTSYTESVRSLLFEHTLNMPVSELNNIGTGALLTRSTQDVNMLQDVLSMLIQTMVVVPVLIIGGSVLAFSVDVYISLLIFAASPLIIAAAIILGKKMLPLINRSNEYVDKQNKIVGERLSGIRVIRAFNMEEQEHGRMKRATEAMADNIIKANVSFGMVAPFALLVINLLTVLIFGIFSVRTQNADIVKVGDIIAVIQYVALIMGAIISSAFAIMMLHRMRVSLRRMNEILTVAPIARGRTASECGGALACENLTFCYPGADKPALSEISFKINEGEKVALIGGTGSGKSALMMILAGFYRKTSGTLTIGGYDYDGLTIDDLNRAFSVVYQRHDIFSGTLRENLDPSQNADDGKIMEALAVAQLDGFADEHGLNYELNQGGSNLSGGQKQRLAIARALMKSDASIYMFDDSFSSLDYLTEQRLRSRLIKAMGNKTMIIATQRVATARNCDKILVFDNGRLVSSGSHKELLERCEIYREIYVTQTGGTL